jgi:hypothetical protein
MGISQVPAPVVSTSAFTPVAEGTLSTAIATFSTNATSGEYELKSAYPAIVTIGSTSATTTANYSPAKLTVSSTTSSISVENSGFGNLWENSSGGSGSEIVYSGDKFVIISSSTSTPVHYSSDGINWSSTTISGQGQSMGSIGFGGGNYVALSNAGGGGSTYGATSSNGTSWTYRTYTGANVNTSNSPTYGNGVWIATSSGYAFALRSTNNGTSFSAVSVPSSSTWNNAAYGNSIFVICASNATAAATSADGITWTARTLPVSGFRSLSFHNGLFFGTASASSNLLYTSTDGITWTSRTLPATGEWSRVFFGAGAFVTCINDSLSAARSYDGFTWAARSVSRTMPGNNKLGAFGNSRYLIFDTNGNASVSINRTTPFGVYSQPSTNY